ncbi:hypothetical protein ESCO_005936 [Escovopsis weberi]|uniref:Uncharacterized protein n=1 Tax=Escovopsis weberi TaxID=150374 RepID=A0A0M8MQG9_ESCWE|nr:hypothetical protein ESCO_005936 [Escovopsis weberi]
MDLPHLLTPPVRLLPLRWLLAPLAVLVVINCATLFAHSDVDIPLLWSQCHSRERLPALSYVPALGTPACFLLSFYEAALDSSRSRAGICVLLAFLGALATVCWLESTRAWNARSPVIRAPTLPWLAFSLLGPAGAVVWHIAIVPAFVHRARTLFLASVGAGVESAGAGRGQASDGGEHRPEASERESERDAQDAALAGEAGRAVPDADVVAITVAVALGFFAPSALMLLARTPLAVALWLPFPAYITLVQRGARLAVQRFQRAGPTSVLLERHWQAVALVYLLPAVLSVAGSVLFWWHLLARPDDRRKMTLLTASFLEINATAVAVAVLYWLFVEAGWRLPVFVVAASCVLGPGGGLCLGWLYRERLLRHGFGPRRGGDGADDDERGAAYEDTPLLR